ncbi:Alpha-1,3/1,6-mannosyltransferase ALG2 [Sesamum angolense]|uniref:Alpha-1,3/1,6-mannosyltransferase ALG2 n=1 Tax=Sesamum angolense TaxID=2727404 RepID=A0AAE1W5H7_9LAMI|nr:Alpha-1,3/1,6-mannosyltransferase ALG2 [Sesamum angolense]
MERRDSSKLNIAIIHPDLGIGGAERLIVDAAVELSSNGHNVHIFTSHHDKTRFLRRPFLVSFQLQYMVLSYLGIFFTVSMLYAHICGVFLLLFVFVYVSFFRHYNRGSGLYHNSSNEAEKVIKGCILLPFSGLVAGSTQYYPSENLSETYRLFRRNDNRLSFLSINRFERKKNIELAISAFAMLYNSQEDFLQGDKKDELSLIVAGGFDKRLRENVEYLEELKNLAEREGVSHRVQFITSCPTSERNTLLSLCLCVIYTPKDEHFGIVPLEAMAAHKPVIACNSGGPVETIKNGVTGYLCDPSPQDFSTAMANFIRDPQMSRTMGREAQQHVMQSFSTKIFGQHLNAYITDTARRKRD